MFASCSTWLSPGTEFQRQILVATSKYARLDSKQRTVFTQSLGIVPRFAWPTSVGSRWAGIVPASFCNTPGWTRTSDPGIRNFRRNDFASPEETTKSNFSFGPSMTCENTCDFASTASFTAQMAEKGGDLRNPRIQVRRSPRQLGHGVEGLRHRRQGVYRDLQGARGQRRPSGRVNLGHAEDLRTRWLFVFLLQQRSSSNPRPCSPGRG